ncbi:hypothetical protein QMT15_20785, partial [Cronobacter sakazakii]|nr:hypothetical protein [Cronobacter sakazakii]
GVAVTRQARWRVRCAYPSWGMANLSAAAGALRLPALRNGEPLPLAGALRLPALGNGEPLPLAGALRLPALRNGSPL